MFDANWRAVVLIALLTVVAVGTTVGALQKRLLEVRSRGQRVATLRLTNNDCRLDYRSDNAAKEQLVEQISLPFRCDFWHGPIVIAVDERSPRVFCLYDFDVSTELIVIEARQVVRSRHRTEEVLLENMIIEPPSTVYLADEEAIRRFRDIVAGMTTSELKESSRPRVDLGFVRLYTSQRNVLELLDGVNPWLGGQWGLNARGEERAS